MKGGGGVITVIRRLSQTNAIVKEKKRRRNGRVKCDSSRGERNAICGPVSEAAGASLTGQLVGSVLAVTPTGGIR